MLAQERQETIIEIINKERAVKVSNLLKIFNVSIETVRRDLEILEKEGRLKRVYGGAVLEKIDGSELTGTDRKTKCIDEKRELAGFATRYVREGQSIALDISTTNLEFARVFKKTVKRLTVLTNSLEIAAELSDMDKYTIILIGGVMRNDELCIVGDLAEEFISKFHIDTAFMSMSGISLNCGLTDYGMGEVQVKKKMMEVAKQTIILADSSKFDVVSLLNVCSLDKVDMIITDSKLNSCIIEKYITSVVIINK
ncbi:DeoR/GlpR family DNA-binding transcription regulator [Clostridium akagii]|uniref:DeoR/GlpR family DNA-binding transcription regulator n=1 Tax=Clostridium akagii TaxID=91623 RepID=UPI00047AC84D|nr:DeoR/GlpR family DNA-binding transcription regulator [Clostridium akagii]